MLILIVRWANLLKKSKSFPEKVILKFKNSDEIEVNKSERIWIKTAPEVIRGFCQILPEFI
jgi:hypothetical protein